MNYKHIIIDSCATTFNIVLALILFEMGFYFFEIRKNLQTFIDKFLSSLPSLTNAIKQQMFVKNNKGQSIFFELNPEIQDNIDTYINNAMKKVLNKVNYKHKINERLAIIITVILILTFIYANAKFHIIYYDKINIFKVIVIFIATYILIIGIELFLYFYVYSKISNITKTKFKRDILTYVKKHTFIDNNVNSNNININNINSNNNNNDDNEINNNDDNEVNNNNLSLFIHRKKK